MRQTGGMARGRDRWSKVSESPTNIGTAATSEQLTAEDLFAPESADELPLDEQLRQAYFWLVNRAIISPYYDIEFSHGEPLRIPLGDAGAELRLPTEQSYSSNVLMPLLTFAVGGKCLLIGGPGRGKTTLAVLMGVLAGLPSREVRRMVQQGQPQLTVSDLVGMPLPKDLVNADSLADIRIAWRDWLTGPVKIVDEYNRIPTKTQSALLTMVAEGYVESYDQMQRTAPENGVEAWFFTANDDAGGGTFPVIQALRDRIDVTVQTAGFNMRFFDELVTRIEAGERPEDHVPAELVFSAGDLATLPKAIRSVPVPRAVRRRLEFFAGQFEFVQHGGRRFEYRTKDSVATAGGRVADVIGANSGADLQVDPGSQTITGLSVRNLQGLILYAKAMAFFRGSAEVTEDDLRAVAPFVLRGKLLPNDLHPAFESETGRELALDSATWVQELWDASVAEFRKLGLDDDDPVGDLLAAFEEGLDGLSAVEVSRRLTAVESAIRAIGDQKKLYGRHFDDLLALKYLHQRYANYQRWLASRS